MKKSNVIFAALFFAVLAAFAAATIFLPPREFSPNENRYLAGRPELSAEQVLSGSFQTELADFLSDQIPGRDFWMQTNTMLKKLLGKKEINGVYLGSDGFYFQRFTDDSYSPARRDALFALLEQFAAEQQIPVTVMPVPTPGVALAEKRPANAPMYDADGVWQALSEQAPSCRLVDLRTVLTDPAHYYRTDHHWTAAGAYAAYAAYCEAMGVPARDWAQFGMERVSEDFYGTIYSKTLDPKARPDEIWAPKNLPEVELTFDGGKTGESVYAPEFLEQKDQYAYFFGGNWGRVDIRTGAGNGKRLLVIKDSFANSMVPYLLEEYEQITMLDLRYFGGSVSQVLTEQGTTEVLFLYEMTNLLTDTGLLKLTR